MCTAIGFKNKDKYFFGRTLDVCASYGEEIIIAPRNFRFEFRAAESIDKHHAIIGSAIVLNGLPLYYDAMNENGLCMAGLNFPANAVYHPPEADRINLGSFELIPYILGKCANLKEARSALENINVADISFSKEMPHTPLHWIIGDSSGEIVVESVAGGLKIYDNPVGVLTNNPPFEAQLFNLKNYAHLSARNPENTFSKALDLTPYSRGMGGFGLPGDWSSPSRFVRAAFVKFNYAVPESGATEEDFFHMLDTVAVPNGCVEGDNGFQYTVYSCCCDTQKGTYTRKTYGGERISVKLDFADLDGCALVRRSETVY